MERTIVSALGSFQRVEEFLTQHPWSDAPATLGLQETELHEAVARLLSDSVDQEAGSRFVRAYTESKRQLRSTLYSDHMLPLSRVAREVFSETGMDRAFRMPKATAANQKLLAAAGAIAEAASKEEDVFLKHGLSQDFLEQLTASVTALANVQPAKTESARRRTTATASAKDQVKRGKKAVRLLNAILQPRLAKDPELLAAWQSAKRVPAQGSSTAASIAPVVPVAPVAPAPPVAHVVASQPSQRPTEKAA